MSPPGVNATEEPTPAANLEGGSSLDRIPRKWRDDAIRVCLDLGYVVSGAEAWRLLKEWRAWREHDTREFIAGEFRTFVQRRGDLLIVRGKARHEWRSHT